MNMNSLQENNLQTESPCIRECKLNKNTDLCISCFRSMEEIRTWRYMSDEQKHFINTSLNERRNFRI
jgi:predicted Fe-S protein YdhL (DUF1289 family)